MSGIALKIESLSVNYDKAAVLWDINLAIPKGKSCCILGPNGAGKSTLLKSAMGLIDHASGEVSFLGRPLSEMRSKVAYVPQRSSVDWDFPITAFDLVLMGRYGKLGWLKWARQSDKLQAKKALELVGMLPFAKRQISELSGGQQQRLFIARALAQEAEIYLMDEPFASLDATTEQALATLFAAMKEEGKTLIVVHHDLTTADRYFDWMVMINTCVVAEGKPQEVFTKENLSRTYGHSHLLLDEALLLSKAKALGVR